MCYNLSEAIGFIIINNKNNKIDGTHKKERMSKGRLKSKIRCLKIEKKNN